MENVGIIIQARLGSSRFPEKVIAKIYKNLTLIEILLKRLSPLKDRFKIIVATTKEKKDDKLEKFLFKKKVIVFRGSKNNLISRYYFCAKKFNIKTIVRITADCPLIDYRIILKMINIFFQKKLQFLCNNDPPTFPDGLDIEIFNFNVLKRAYNSSTSDYDKEHVCPFIKKIKKIIKQTYILKQNKANIRLTVDYEDDLKIISFIINSFKNNFFFTLNDVLNLYKKNKKIFSHNVQRNEGGYMNNDQKKWARAKNKILGGNMLLSKRPERYLPKKWPAYYLKSKKCFIWDLNGKKYLDLCLMGVGTNILGYSNDKVNKKVIEAIKSGNVSSFNCEEELILAEKILEINPWASKVKFAKTGGEANTIALRIARSFSNKQDVAFCGYHGWHDWYLSANFKKKSNLDRHLLSGLSTTGVHKKLKNTATPFEYNNFDQLKKIINHNNNIGIIFMEVMRNQKPKNNFLKKVRKLANKKKLILIFDECTSGFRETFGGICKKFNVIPDIIVYGKALGNGYPITCVAGKKEIMNAAEDSFISSTYWSDRVGYVAALETLSQMNKEKSWKKISKIGKYIKKKWLFYAKKNKIKIKTQGLDAIPSFYFLNENHEKFVALITREMLKKNILASNVVYVCVHHNKLLLKKYFKELNQIFSIIKKCIEKKEIAEKILNFELPTKSFGRLN
jgi:glutamate-1-semialdehyde 2,1-aminomutase